MQVLLCSAILASLLLNVFQLSAQSPAKELQLKLNAPPCVVEETLLSVTSRGMSGEAGRVFINMNYYYDNGQKLFKIHFQPELKNPKRNSILAFDKGGGSNDLFRHISELSQWDIIKGRFLPDHVLSFYQTSPKVLELQNAFPLGYVDFEQATTDELVFIVDIDNLMENNTFIFLLQFYHGSYSRQRDRLEVHSLFRPFRYKIELISGQNETIGPKTLTKTIATADCPEWYAERYADLETINNNLKELDVGSRLNEIEIILSQSIGNNTARYKAELSEIRQLITRHRDNLDDLNSLVIEKANECEEQAESLMSGFSVVETDLDNLIIDTKRLEGLVTRIDSKVAEYEQYTGQRSSVKASFDEERGRDNSQQTFLEYLNEVILIYEKVNNLRLSAQHIDRRLQQELSEDKYHLGKLKRDFDQIFSSLTPDVQDLFLTSYERFDNYYKSTLAILKELNVETIPGELPQTDDMVKKAERTGGSFKILAYILIVIVVSLLGFIIIVRVRAVRLKNKYISQARPPAANKAVSSGRRIKGTAAKVHRFKI